MWRANPPKAAIGLSVWDEAGDYTGAIPLFERALQPKPDLADAREDLAQANL